MLPSLIRGDLLPFVLVPNATNLKSHNHVIFLRASINLLSDTYLRRFAPDPCSFIPF